MYMEPVVGAVPAGEAELSSEVTTPPVSVGAAPQIGSAEDLVSGLRLEVQGGDGQWGTLVEVPDGAQVPRTRGIARDIILYLLNGRTCRSLYVRVRNKRTSEAKAISDFRGIDIIGR